MNKNQIIETIKNLLMKNEEVEFAYLFGSFALDLETPLSDIDIAIYQKQIPNLSEKQIKSTYDYRMTEFKIESQLIEAMPAFNFDVRSFNDAPIIVIGEILTEGKLLFFKDENIYYDFFEISILKYMDYSLIYNPLLNEQFKNLLNDK